MYAKNMIFYSLMFLSSVSLASENGIEKESVAIVWCQNSENEDCKDRFSYIHYPEKYTHHFGVFDGHCGVKTANYLVHKIPSDLKKQTHDDFRTAITKVLSDADEAVKNFNDGSTAVVVNINKNKCSIANVGDSRAVLLDFGMGKHYSDGIKFYTKDHRPEGEELARIERAGGYCCHRNGYAYASKTASAEMGLAMTRVIGDHDLDSGKKVFIPTPDCTEFDLDDLSANSYVIVATDGLWDQVSNKRASKIVRAGLSDSDSFLKIAKSLVQEAINRHSSDDITCMLIKIKALIPDNKACVEREELKRPGIKIYQLT